MLEPQIPIQNLYFLLCYAWNHLKQGELVDVSNVPSTELADLFAVVLCGGIEHLARRGLEQAYEPHEDDLPGVRGRVDVLKSGRRFLLLHGRAACKFDDLTANTLPNQIIKSTLKVLDQFSTLHGDIRKRVRQLRQSLPGIEEKRITSHSFRRVQLHSNNQFYRFLISVCKLIHSSALVDPTSGSYRFRDFVRDERTMAKVFQDFLYNFIRLEIPTWAVKREHIAWKATSTSDPGFLLLPRMETDISLRRGSHHVIIHQTPSAHTQRFLWLGEDSQRGIHQLMSYLTNTAVRDGESVVWYACLPSGRQASK